MGNSKAQITLFIILGIVILMSVSLIIYFSLIKSEETNPVIKNQIDILPIKNYVEFCIKSVGEDAIIWIGEHGGYYELPQYSDEYYPTDTAYYFYVDKNIMPSKSRVEEELSKYVDEKLPLCVKDFVDFKKQGFEIEQGEINTTTLIRSSNVLFQVNFPITVKKQTSETKFTSFSNSVENIRLDTIYYASKSIIDEQMKDFNSICLSCLFNLTVEKDLYINTEKAGNDIILFTITDLNSKINNSPYTYTFANKYEQYSCTNLPPDADMTFHQECIEQKVAEIGYKFYLEEIPDMNAAVDQLFHYKVNASGLGIAFTDISYLFEIDEKAGVINFTPTAEQIGIHTIWIYVKDKLGNEIYDNFVLNITENES